MQQGSMEGVLSVSKESLHERDPQEDDQEVRVSKKCRRKPHSKHLRKFSKNTADLQVIDLEEKEEPIPEAEEVDQSPERTQEQSSSPEMPAAEKENREPRLESRVSSRSPARSRPQSNSMRPRTTTSSRMTSGRTSTAHTAKRTISRTSRKSRPTSVATFREHERDTESENESEDLQTRTVLSDIMDFGVDIFADQGWDTDLEADEEPVRPTSFDGSLRGVYLESCKQHSVIPASYFLRHMNDQHLQMRHHGLGPVGVKPIAVAMVSNTSVTKLDLSDNWLGKQGGTHVCEMLKENCYIYNVTLSDNHLGLDFAYKFIEVLKQNSTLTHVTLSGNELDDQAAVPIAEAMMNTTRLEYLDLSHNRFGEAAGLILGPAISENSSIKNLDLSWNSLSRRGAVAVAKGVQNNVLMAKINLSWNGFGKDGAKAIGDALKVNSSLEELDLGNNRITTEGAVLLGKGLTVNETLKVLNMARNPMQSAGCFAVCAAISKNPSCVIDALDFSDILVNEDFREVLRKVKENLPDLMVKTGGDGIPKKPKARVHPMVKLRNYIERNNLRLVDFFNKFDKDNSMSVTREEFAQGIESMGLDFTQDEIQMLVTDLDEDNDGQINYSELVMGHQDFTEKEKKMATTILQIKSSNDQNNWKHTSLAT